MKQAESLQIADELDNLRHSNYPRHFIASHNLRELHKAKLKLISAIKRLVNSNPGLANLTNDGLRSAISRPESDPVVREQSAAVLQTRSTVEYVSKL